MAMTKFDLYYKNNEKFGREKDEAWRMEFCLQ